MKQYLQIGTLLALVIAGIILFFLAVRALAPLLVLILIAIVITTGIDPLVGRLERWRIRRWRMPRALATLLVLLLGLLVILGAVGFLLGTAINQAIAFARNVELQNQLYAWAAGLAARYDYIPDPGSIIARVQQQSGQIAQYLWTTTIALFGILGGAFSAVTVFILTFFFTNYKRGIAYTLTQLVPPQYQGRVREVGHQAAQKMGGWLRGQLILAFLITIIIAIFMSLFPELNPR